MTMINGAKHDVEDILASIRTSIADRSPMFESEKREVRTTTLRGRSAIADEAEEVDVDHVVDLQPGQFLDHLQGQLRTAVGMAEELDLRHAHDRPARPLLGLARDA